ncbi:MAG: ribulokinase [Kiritimatiellae bacterium]|nr:ribulokinase [Kiritimatiellia bacterium]
MKAKYAMGLDYGTNSCRSVIVNLDSGEELASHVFCYPSGEMGVLTDRHDPNLARQHPADYLAGLEEIIKRAIGKAREADAAFSPEMIVGVGVDTTGSTPLPVDREAQALALSREFKDNLDACAWLWKDHTSHAEAAEITAKARATRPQYMAVCGGTYSSEWFWAKIWHCLRMAPEVYKAAHSFVELCDWIPAVLTGCRDPLRLRRSVCAAGHKAMFSREWGGLPDEEFLDSLDPALSELRGRLYGEAYTSDAAVGTVCAEWAERTGLSAGTVVAVGALDAHMGAVGAGCSEGVLVKILGTSACDLMVAGNGSRISAIPGVCGIVDGSVLPGYYGIEAGQAAVGDLFLWFVNNFAPQSLGTTNDEKFAALNARAALLRPGESGLLALDWNNGNRCLLEDPRLSGMLLGQTLRTTAAEVYRALVEATAFGAKMITGRVIEHGVKVRQVTACGGLASKSPLLMQIYADVLGVPLEVSSSDQTCALGSAMFGAAAAGHFPDMASAQSKLCREGGKVYIPDPAGAAVYSELFGLYRQLHDGFGLQGSAGGMGNVMKALIAIRERERQAG